MEKFRLGAMQVVFDFGVLRYPKLPVVRFVDQLMSPRVVLSLANQLELETSVG